MRGIALDTRIGAAYVATDGDSGSSDSKVAIVDLSTGVTISSLPVPERIGYGFTSMAVDETTHTLYVTSFGDSDGSGLLTVIDGLGRRVIASVSLPRIPFGVALDPSTHAVYVTGRNYYGSSVPGGMLSVLDGATHVIRASIPVPEKPLAVVVDPSLHTAYVADYADNAASSIVVIDTQTNRITSTIRVPIDLFGIVSDPSSHDVFVAGALPSKQSTRSDLALLVALQRSNAHGVGNVYSISFPVGTIQQLAIDEASHLIFASTVSADANNETTSDLLAFNIATKQWYRFSKLIHNVGQSGYYVALDQLRGTVYAISDDDYLWSIPVSAFASPATYMIRPLPTPSGAFATEAYPGGGNADQGKMIFLGQGGCSACHTVAGTSASGEIGPNLTHVGARLTADQIYSQVISPAQHPAPYATPLQRGAEMPTNSLSPQQREDITAWLSEQK